MKTVNLLPLLFLVNFLYCEEPSAVFVSTQTSLVDTIKVFAEQTIETVKNAVKVKSKRSSEWSKVRKEFLKKHPCCEVCGSTKKLVVHHIIPFQVRPDLELVESNLITLCQSKKRGGLNCHLTIGHGGDFKDYNPNVVEDAKHFHDLFFNKQIDKLKKEMENIKTKEIR